MKDHANFGTDGSLITESDSLPPSDANSGKNTLPVQGEVKVITSNNDFDLLCQKWNMLAWRSNTHIFQTFEWNRSWWECFGADHELHILAVYSGKKLIGLAPFFKDHIKIYDRQVYSCLRFIGSTVTQPKGPPLLGLHSYSDYLDFITLPGFERIFYRMILQYFKHNLADVNEIVLEEIPEESTFWKSFKPELEEGNFSYKIEDDSITPVIQLESTWNLYLKTMKSKERTRARKYLKRSKEGKAKMLDVKKVEYNEDLPNVISDFINMHQRQWNERGFAGTFSEKRMQDFSAKIIKQFYQRDLLKIIKAVPITENEKAIAYDVILTYKNRVYLLYRGMETASEYSTQAPGIVLLYAHLNEAIQNGAKVFNFLRGEEEYKFRLANIIKQNKKVVIIADLRKKRFLPILAMHFILYLKHARLEWVQAKLMLTGETGTAGVKKYAQFIIDRFKHKFMHK